MKVRKGDTVLVISGKDKGPKGAKSAERIGPQPGIGRCQPDQEAHRDLDRSGARVEWDRRGGADPAVSNVMVVDSDGKPTRIGYRVDEETGKRVRISKRSPAGHLMTTAQRFSRASGSYRSEIRDALRKQFGYGNVMQIPTVTKVVVNMECRRGPPRTPS